MTNEGLVDFIDNRYEAYQSRNVAGHEPCRSCSVVLPCGGGCPLQAEIANGTIYSNHCDSHKELVARSIIAFVEKKTDERELHTLDSNRLTKEEMTPFL
ncbi:SPASM domain-containing protein [Candidatus Nitronereus thalassa]|uniref:SPASM domain-containing protein n=1 Tax=Candidatus Nitronereus thalassa TaxID=3020898 RepID=A0ABU3K8Z0_9BACT|nr:SPASM domain-containing protein [Candidatus Nitronereus thalassa]MDT7042855.1 SPASM domain-containing protein [Candidatus Nitronereus thalassa]